MAQREASFQEGSSPRLAHPGTVRLLWVVAWAGIGARIALVFLSLGSNDIVLWRGYGQSIAQSGLAALYHQEPLFNHPPLMGLGAAAMTSIARQLNLPFAFVFKAAAIAADILALLVIARSWRDRAGERTASVAAALYGWAPCAILIAGFHGNTDSICAALLLLATYLACRVRWPFAAGLAFAAAVNVKVIPFLALPALLATLRDRRVMARFVAAMLLGAVPFAVAGLAAGLPMFRNTLLWAGNPEPWGVAGLVRWVASTLGLEFASIDNSVKYPLKILSRILLLAILVAVAWRARRANRCLDERLPTIAIALFLVLAPGFGVQYVIYLCPLLFLADIAAGACYAWVAGAFLAAVYLQFLASWLPLTTLHTGQLGPGAQVFGALTCLTMVAAIVRLWRAKAGPEPQGDALTGGVPASLTRGTADA